MSGIQVYSVGLVFLSACASSDTPREEIERYANAEFPTGISSGWTVTEEDFASGDPNGRPCEQNPETRQHWLLSC